MEKSLAMELVQDYKKSNDGLLVANKRLFILLLVVLVLWFATIGLFIYYINTNMIEESTIIETADTSDGGNACVGDNCNNGEINYG